jgi:hypothetical protein
MCLSLYLFGRFDLHLPVLQTPSDHHLFQRNPELLALAWTASTDWPISLAISRDVIPDSARSVRAYPIEARSERAHNQSARETPQNHPYLWVHPGRGMMKKDTIMDEESQRFMAFEGLRDWCVSALKQVERQRIRAADNRSGQRNRLAGGKGFERIRHSLRIGRFGRRASRWLGQQRLTPCFAEWLARRLRAAVRQVAPKHRSFWR